MKPEVPFTPPEAGVRTTSGPRRTALHRFVGALAWLLVAAGWWRALTRLSWATVLEPMWLVAVLTLGGFIITALWISHNRRIFQVRGPRSRRRVGTPDWRKDYLKRTVVGPLEAARFAPYVELSYTWERKIYRPAPLSELGAEYLAKQTGAAPGTWAQEIELVPAPEIIRGHGAEDEEALEEPEAARGIVWPGLRRADGEAEPSRVVRT